MTVRLIIIGVQLQETKNLVRSRDQRLVELQIEAEQLREQAARQNAIVLSLKERIQVTFLSFAHNTVMSIFELIS